MAEKTNEEIKHYGRGDWVNTPDGPGRVICRERFNNGEYDYRVGVLHDTFPKNKPKGLYDDDVLYYFLREITRQIHFCPDETTKN